MELTIKNGPLLLGHTVWMDRTDMVGLPGGVLHELGGVGHGVYYHVQRVPQTNTTGQV